MNTLEEFKVNIQGAREPREHKVTGSIGVYDAYKYIRKNKWFNIGRPLTEKEFYSIVRKVGIYLAEELCKGSEVKFPAQMGVIELRKTTPFVGYKEGKLVTNLPIDWDATLKLWYEDPEAYQKKQLVKINEKEVFRVLYNRENADYNNKSFYEFQVNRDIKRTLKKRIKQGRIDAFLKKQF